MRIADAHQRDVLRLLHSVVVGSSTPLENNKRLLRGTSSVHDSDGSDSGVNQELAKRLTQFVLREYANLAHIISTSKGLTGNEFFDERQQALVGVLSGLLPRHPKLVLQLVAQSMRESAS